MNAEINNLLKRTSYSTYNAHNICAIDSEKYRGHKDISGFAIL